MSKETVIVGSIFVILAISFLIGICTKKATSVQQFIGSTKMFGPLVTGLSSTAAMVSGMIMVGGTSAIYLGGNSLSLSAFIGFCFSLSYIFIGKKMRAMAEVGSVSSLGDIIALRYNSRTIKTFSCLVIFIGCFAYLITQIAAGASLFKYLFGWPPLVTAAVVFGIVILYVAIGGESAGILSQAFQGAIIVVVGIVICMLFFFKFGGFGGVMNAVIENPTVIGSNGITANFCPGMLGAFGTDQVGAKQFTWILFSLVGVCCQPATLTRMYAIRDPRDLPKAGLISAITQGIASFSAMLMGLCVVYLVATGKIAPLETPDEAVWHLAEYLGMTMNILIASSVMCAIISSASMYLSTSASLLSKDILSCFNVKLDDKRQIMFYRLSIVVLGAIGIVIASLNSEMVIWLGFLGWGMLMTVTLPVFVIGIVWKRVSRPAMIFSVVSAFILNIAALILNQKGFVWPAGIPWYMNVICFTVVSCIIISFFTYDKERDGLSKGVNAALDL